MKSIKDRYGNKLTKKQKKPRPSYWRLTNMLNRLRVPHKTRGEGSAQFHIIVPDFGMMFRFNPLTSVSDYNGWDIIDVDLNKLEVNDTEFGENLMWLLISKGYMAYLRNKESGDFQVFHHFIMREGWGRRIIDKRLELYNNEPKHKFMIERNKRMRDMSISYIITHYPDFFDYLW